MQPIALFQVIENRLAVRFTFPINGGHVFPLVKLAHRKFRRLSFRHGDVRKLRRDVHLIVFQRGHALTHDAVEFRVVGVEGRLGFADRAFPFFAFGVFAGCLFLTPCLYR